MRLSGLRNTVSYQEVPIATTLTQTGQVKYREMSKKFYC